MPVFGHNTEIQQNIYHWLRRTTIFRRNLNRFIQRVEILSEWQTWFLWQILFYTETRSPTWVELFFVIAITEMFN